MAQEMESRPQSDSSGLIPVFVGAWVLVAGIIGFIMFADAALGILYDMLVSATRFVFGSHG